jgi:sugar (pentulose or hexulose) kinase
VSGRLLAREKIEYEPYVSPAPGWAEQDAEIYYRALVTACRRLRERHGPLMERVRGVGVTTQRDTLVCLDSEGRTLRPAILWLDQRRAEPSYRPGRAFQTALGVIGMGEALARTQEANRVAWIQQNEPEVWKKTAQVLQVSGFLNLRLTGERADSIASQIGHIPFDYRRQEWARPEHLSARLFPVESERLPRLLRPGETLGHITAKAAEETGLPEGLPVIAAGSDKGCETIGMGVIDCSMAALSFGTTATVQTTSRRYFEPISFMPAYPALIPGAFNPEVEIFRGYWMITWFKNQFAYQEVLEAQRRNLPPELMLDELLKSTPPGAMGLVMQPYWSPGLDNPNAKGALIGFGDVHTRAHVYRALIEGLAFGLLEGLEAIERKGRCRVERLTVSGGASQSDEICQIAADVFNRPLLRGRTHETSGLGAAMATAAGLGFHPSVEAAISAMKVYQHEFRPRQQASAVYRELYERVYRRMDRALGPLYRETREIVNYPARRG